MTTGTMISLALLALICIVVGVLIGRKNRDKADKLAEIAGKAKDAAAAKIKDMRG